MDYSRLFLMLGAAGGGTAVVLGAFAAHGLRGRLDAALLHAFETAVTYQFFHSIALCVLGVWCRQFVRQPEFGDAAVVSGLLFSLGIVLFCGSLYALTFGAPRWVGPITPLGGIAFIGGWVALLVSAWRS